MTSSPVVSYHLRMPAVTTVQPDRHAIRLTRERAGLTQEELAELLARPGKTLPRNRSKVLSNIERGNQTMVSLRLIAQIAKALGVEPEALIKSASEDEAA